MKSCKIRAPKILSGSHFYTNWPLQNHIPTLPTPSISDRLQYKGDMVMKPPHFMELRLGVSFMKPPHFMEIKFGVNFMKPPHFMELRIGVSWNHLILQGDHVFLQKIRWHPLKSVNITTPIHSHTVRYRSSTFKTTHTHSSKATACHRWLFPGRSLACRCLRYPRLD